MKTPEEYFKEKSMEEHVISTHYAKTRVWLSDFVKEIQVDSYNQAIQDAVENAKVIEKCEFNKIHQENYFEYVVDKDSILKLKIK